MTHLALLPVDLVRKFVIAGHGDLDKVKALLAETPQLLQAAYPWQENDTETALQGAAQVGNVAVAEFLLSQGAPLDICTAAMLGREADVRQMLKEDPTRIQATGAHGIPLLPHAAISGSVPLVEMLVQSGAEAGASFALHNAVSRGHSALVGWLLANSQPDLGWKNYQGKTALATALERQDETTARLLQAHGAVE